MAMKNTVIFGRNGIKHPEATSSLSKNTNHTPVRSGKYGKLDLCRSESQNCQSSDISVSVKTVVRTKKLNPQSQTPIKSNGLRRSQSIPSLSGRDVKYGNEVKKRQCETRMTKSTSGDKTPVTQFCTPKYNEDGGYEQSPCGGHNRKLQDNPPKCSLKRFFSEVNLMKPSPSATPECFNNVQLETPRGKHNSADLPDLDIETSNLTVGVRVRPLNTRERNDVSITNIVTVDGNEVKVGCESGTSLGFVYDHCFWSCDPQHPQFASQDVVFSTMVQPLVDKAFLGYNACLFAYGQTGSGKSYSMMGLDLDSGSNFGKEAGIIPRFFYEVFERIASLEDRKVSKSSSARITVEISYFEIYNEKIHDLLGGSSETGKRAPLKVREHPIFGPYVVDLSTHGVKSYEDLQGWLLVGNSQRATAATGMNEKSSRSHSIFSVILTQTQDEIVMGELHENSLRSKINLVDLAGSERLSQTCASGDRLREGVSINRSLLTLGKVIACLVDNANMKRKGFVPYRDSVLTWLLRESLGGNSRTTMLATISPASIHVEETLSTLRYACQARTIVNRVHINEDPHDRLIRELRAEVERLRALREEYERQKKMGIHHHLVDNDMASEIRCKELEIGRLKEQLQQSEEHLHRTHKSWAERLQEAEKCKSAELQFLRRCGVAVQLIWDQQLPCLVNLSADPILSGTLLYLLPPGIVQVGRHNLDSEELQADITLQGPLVQKNHCSIKNDNGTLSLIPLSNAQTFVNGISVTRPIVLHHGDRVVIGGNHYFRVNNPKDSTEDQCMPPADYHFAYQEVHKVQEDRLRAELEEAKRHALEELEETRKEAAKQLACQRSAYEERLEQLGSSLEQHKDALSEVLKTKEELELQKQVLEAEVKSHRVKRSHFLTDDESLVISPYQSNFLKEIEEILNGTISQTPTDSHGPNLHEMQVMVQEATQHCRELGINYEFSHCHIVGELGLHSIVRVRNLDKHLTLSWNPDHFICWLDRLRHYDSDDSLNQLLDIEDEEGWEEDEWEERETSYDNHILIDTKKIKRELNKSIQQLSFESSWSNDSETAVSQGDMDTTNPDYSDYSFDQDMNTYVQQIEDAAVGLQKLCKTNKMDHVKITLDALEKVVKQLRSTLNLNQSMCSILPAQNIDEYGEFTTDSKCLLKIPDLKTPPSKSSLRSPAAIGSTPKVHKMVRFKFTNSQQERHLDI